MSFRYRLNGSLLIYLRSGYRLLVIGSCAVCSLEQTSLRHKKQVDRTPYPQPVLAETRTLHAFFHGGNVVEGNHIGLPAWLQWRAEWLHCRVGEELSGAPRLVAALEGTSQGVRRGREIVSIARSG